ncbi:uncharacterized protein V6R79_012771 [Siganus canaliculatus]
MATEASCDLAPPPPPPPPPPPAVRGDTQPVPRQKVYRPLFDAQAQLSRSLLLAQRHERKLCLPAEDSSTHCSAASRSSWPPSTGGQQSPDVDADDVRRLPATVVVDRPTPDFFTQQMEKRRNRHREALEELETGLIRLQEVTGAQVRSCSVQLLSSLQEVDLRLEVLEADLEDLEDQDQQQVCSLWRQVEEELKKKKIQVLELDHELQETEKQRTDQARALLGRCCHLLEGVGFLPADDIVRLMHGRATMLNLTLLANRRSAARLLLRLQEQNLQQESLLRLQRDQWERSRRRRRAEEVVRRFRASCDEDRRLLVEHVDEQTKQTLGELTQRRWDLISRICSLVPPSCSTALVSDWFDQLTAVNQQIDGLHGDVLQQLRRCVEEKCQHQLEALQCSQEALSALQLSEEEVNEVVQSQLLLLIGQRQREDEEQLSALDVGRSSVACRALSLSTGVFVLLKGAALLWETHGRSLEARRGGLQQQLEQLRASQQQQIQRKKVHLDGLLAGLHQADSQDVLKTSLDQAVVYLETLRDSCRDHLTDQRRLLDRLPSVLLKELGSYSATLSALFRLSPAYVPDPAELQVLSVPLSDSADSEISVGVETLSPSETEDPPISCQNGTGSAQLSHNWLTEVETSTMDLYDNSGDVTITSSRGVVYHGPAFRLPPSGQQQETLLSLFPTELLTRTLSRSRTLVLDHLDQHVHDVLSSAVAMVTDRKEAAHLEVELYLLQLDPDQIQNHIHQARLDELQCRGQAVEAQCEEVLQVVTSFQEELMELETSLHRRHQEFITVLSNMDEDIRAAASSHSVAILSSTFQDRVDQHIKDTQFCEMNFRQRFQTRAEQVMERTRCLLQSFSEADVPCPEVKLWRTRLMKESRHLTETVQSIYSHLDSFSCCTLQQVNDAVCRSEEKLCRHRSEVNATEKIHRILSSTRVQLQAEVAYSNRQQSAICSKLDKLRTMMKLTQVGPAQVGPDQVGPAQVGPDQVGPDQVGPDQVGPDQVFPLLSSLHQDLLKRFHYLDCPQESTRAQVQPCPWSQEPVLTDVDFEDPVVDMIRTLSRFSEVEARRPAGQSPVPHPPRGPEQKHSEPVSSLKTDRTFQPRGPEPSAASFSSTVSSVLGTASRALATVAEDVCLDQSTRTIQDRLLGHQDQARRILSTSRDELDRQLSLWDELLRCLPAALICNHEQRQEAELREEVGGVMAKLEETLAASEQEKSVNFEQLRASLSDIELENVNRREEQRQQQLHGAICSSELELQERVRRRGEEFGTSLVALTEKLLHHLDTWTQARLEVTMETRQAAGGASRTRSGSSPACTDEPTVAIATPEGHPSVAKQRDAAVKRFDQLLTAAAARSGDVHRRRLRDLQSWTAHWRQQSRPPTHGSS